MTTRQVELLKAANYPNIYNSDDQAPCFHVEGGHFCLRASHWDGHDRQHLFISLEDLLRSVIEESESRIMACVTRAVTEEIGRRALTKALSDVLSTFEGEEPNYATEERLGYWREVLRHNEEKNER